MRADPRRRSAGGFTLIEVMVAIAVFSLAALALIRLESATIRGAATLSDTLLANAVAGNVAIEALTDQRPPTLGPASGAQANGGRDWRWTRNVRAIGDGQALLIEVGVADANGRVIAHRQLVRVLQGGPAS